MKKKLIRYLNLTAIIILAVISSTSCLKQNPTTIDGGIDGTTIPKDFDWKTVSELTVSIQVNPIENVSNDLYHIIKVYSAPMLAVGNLVTSGTAKPGTAFNFKMTVPAGLTKLYVEDYKPNGLKTLTQVDVTSSVVNINLTKSAQSKIDVLTKSSQAVSPSPAVTIPTNYDVVLNNNNSLDLTGFSSGQSSAFGNKYKSYYIPAGFVRTGKINFGNWLEHSIIYVKGKLNLSDNAQLNKSSIVVLSGGSVSVSEVSTGVSDATIPSIYIEDGGVFTSNGNVSLSNSKDFVNKGSFMSNGNFDLNNNSNFYNEGKLSVAIVGKKKLEMIVTNNAYLYNSGQINCAKFSLSTNSSLMNDSHATLSTSKWEQSNSTIVNNSGEILAYESMNTTSGATINNNCSIIVNLLYIQGTNLNLGGGSILNAVDVKVNNSYINMSGSSMLTCSNLLKEEFHSMRINSSASEYSVFKCLNSAPDFRYTSSEIKGKVEFVHNGLQEGSGTNGKVLYESLFNNNGSILSKNQTNNIVETTCNNGDGVITPPAPIVIDNDGDGVPAEFDVNDNNPNIALVSFFPSENTWGTYAFEDLWPWKGDYDMNDLVLGFKISYFSNASNMVTEMHVDFNLMALGSSLDLAFGMQLDKINADNIISVSGQRLEGTGPFEINANGTEKGATLAIIPLFNRGKSLVSFTGFLNTESGSHVGTSNEKLIIKFASPTSQDKLSMSSVNMFIVVNGNGGTSRGKEIHLASYKPTSKVDASLSQGTQLSDNDKYKFKDGMMWGLMFPNSFLYPIERKSLSTAYINFMKWASSGGVAFPDWYINKDGYTVDEFIYSY